MRIITKYLAGDQEEEFMITLGINNFPLLFESLVKTNKIFWSQ